MYSIPLYNLCNSGTKQSAKIKFSLGESLLAVNSANKKKPAPILALNVGGKFNIDIIIGQKSVTLLL